MEEKNFQYSVLGGLILLILIVIIGFSAKKTKTSYGTSVSMFGKTVLKNKKLKTSLEEAKEEETKKAIQEAHGLKAKELTDKAA